MKCKADPWLIVGLILSLLLGAYNGIMEFRRNNADRNPDEVASVVLAAAAFGVAFKGSRGKPEKGGGPSKTEQSGYIPPRVQIERMIMSGQRLALARKEEFDSYDPNVEPELDPTRSPGFDLADAATMAVDVSARLQESQDKADGAKVVPGPPETLSAEEIAALRKIAAERAPE